MKLLRIALSVALFTTTFTGIIQTKEASPTEYSVQEKDFIQKAFYSAVVSLQQIDQIIGELALLVSKHQIRGIANPDHILRILKDDRQLLGSLLQTVSSADKNPEIQLQCTVVLLQLCTSFIPHIEAGLQTDLKKLEPFDISLLTKRKIDINKLTPKSLHTMIQTIQEKIENLKIIASKAGLTWYNKVARSVDKNFVTQWNRYHGTTIAKGLGGAALLSGYIIMKYGKNTDNSIIQSIHTFLNKKAATLFEVNSQGKLIPSGSFESLSDTQQQKNQHFPQEKAESVLNNIDDKMTAISLLELAISETAKGHAPLAMFAGGILWGFYTETWKKSISPWIDQKQGLAWNFLRGGSYLNAETPGLLSLEPKVNFDNMVGLEEVKEAFKSILEYIDDPEKFLRSNSQPETGWILTGPTRTGKSFSFECLCGEIVRMQKRKGLNPDFKFLKLGIEEIAKYSIQGLLAFAKDNAPMIIFVDEIDLLGLQRVGDNKLLHDFLTALQNTHTDDPSKIVIVMAATNSPETVDKALRQYGRLGKEIRFEYPGFKYRKQYLMKELDNMALNPMSFDIDTIIAKTDGRSYEELKAIIRTAMTRAWAQGIPLTQHLIEQSINTEINKIIMHDRKELPEHETRILASHFAGKALAMQLLDTHAKLDTVTIKAVMTEIHEVTAWHAFGQKDKKDMQQKIVHGALFTKIMHDTIELKSETHILNDVKILIAGFIAEEIILGSCGMQCHPEDNNKAYSIVDQLIFKGIDPNQLSKKVREQLRDKAYTLLTQCRQEVRQLLEEHKDTLAAITEELIQHSILSDKDVQAVINRIEK